MAPACPPALPCRTSSTCTWRLSPTDTLKYELDKNTGHLRVDRPQRYSSLCPTVYGFLLGPIADPRSPIGRANARVCPTSKGDGDPLDICVLTEREIVHDVFVSARPIAGSG